MAIDVHMKILPPAQEKMMRAIRDAIALDPLISIRSLQEVLERRGVKIASREYLTKLVWKLNREAKWLPEGCSLPLVSTVPSRLKN